GNRTVGSNPSLSAIISLLSSKSIILSRPPAGCTHNYTHNFGDHLSLERPRSGAVMNWEGGTDKEDQMSTTVQAHRLVSSDRVIGTDVYGVQIDHLFIEKVS